MGVQIMFVITYFVKNKAFLTRRNKKKKKNFVLTESLLSRIKR